MPIVKVPSEMFCTKPKCFIIHISKCNASFRVFLVMNIFLQRIQVPSNWITLTSCNMFTYLNSSTKWMTRWVMRSKNVGGNLTSSMHNVSTTKMWRAFISFWFTTFVHMRWIIIPKHISVLRSPSCNKFWMSIGIICCTITCWSWFFMCCNLQLPTYFFNIATYFVGACTLATKSTKAFASFRVKTYGVCGFLLIHPLVGETTSVASP